MSNVLWMWPDAPHRVLRSEIEAARAFTGEVVGTLPTPAGPFVIPPYAVPSPTRDTVGAIDAMALHAGESVFALERVQPAAEIVREIVADAVELLRSIGAATGPPSR